MQINWTEEKKTEVLEFITKEFEANNIFSAEHIGQDDFLSGQGSYEFLTDLATIIEPIIETDEDLSLNN